jgi:nucleotide-binding universal stress UspA family protein
MVSATSRTEASTRQHDTSLVITLSTRMTPSARHATRARESRRWPGGPRQSPCKPRTSRPHGPAAACAGLCGRLGRRTEPDGTDFGSDCGGSPPCTSARSCIRPISQTPRSTHSARARQRGDRQARAGAASHGRAAAGAGAGGLLGRVGAGRWLAHTAESQLHLLHVVEPIPAPYYAGTLASRFELNGPVRENIEQSLREWSGDIEGARWSVAEGSAPGEIARVARNIGADLVVMGTRGLTGLEHVLIGSVTERVCRLSETPGLVVRNA